MNSSGRRSGHLDILDSTQVEHESPLESLARYVIEDRAPPGMEYYGDRESSLPMSSISYAPRRLRSGSMDTLAAGIPQLRRRSNSLPMNNGPSLTHVRLSRVPLRPSEDLPPSSRRKSSAFSNVNLAPEDNEKVDDPWLVSSGRPQTAKEQSWFRRVLYRLRHLLDEPGSDTVLRRAGIDESRGGLDFYQPPIEIPYYHTARYHISSPHKRRIFITELAYALMQFGSPVHKIEEHLITAARFLDVPARFVILDTSVMCVFGESDGSSSQTQYVDQAPGLSLSKLRDTHLVFFDVIHDRISAGEGIRRLRVLRSMGPPYGNAMLLVFAFLAGFSICPIGFGGSWADALIAGALSCALKALQIWYFQREIFIGIFEMTICILNSLAARLLNSIRGHIFCYSAISSSGVVLILPGFVVFLGSLELASKNILTGAAKIVYAIVYSLSLGFCLTLGSDIAFVLEPNFRQARGAMARDLERVVVLSGTFTPMNGTNTTAIEKIFSFTQSFLPTEPIDKYHYVLEGCYRDPSWPVILQPPPWEFVFLLVPLFVFTLTSLNGSHWRSFSCWIQVLFGCASFAAKKVGDIYIFDRGDIVSAMGATAVGILGTIYGHWRPSDALSSMIPGVLVLLPSGLSVVGGLSQNYHNPSGSISTWLSTGLRMLQVTIGITVGLFASQVAVIAFMGIVLHDTSKSLAF
ncbi:uncharacterized protein EI90DRAFT_3046031 [Cantharellus anzutake]|uniref:uncharacterized protein n=1 Tax=Cantharellus anzutake TaxID=1750568 RepID=UPI0019040CD0|nr:uncharacterized protein EI90DRAFT_3046031 [Cantharellus anzutake]KAF8336513.1 hypothetical protein EI90DRAFT_3046031 [Cantharellus anzutake]